MIMHRPACSSDGDCNLYVDMEKLRVALIGHPESIGDTSGLVNAVKETKAPVSREEGYNHNVPREEIIKVHF